MELQQFETIDDYTRWLLSSSNTPAYEDINRSIPILDKLMSFIYFENGPKFDIITLLDNAMAQNERSIEEGYWEIADKHALSTLISKTYRQAQQQQSITNLESSFSTILSPTKINNIPANNSTYNNSNNSTNNTKIDRNNTSNNIFKLLLSPSLKQKPTKVTSFLDATENGVEDMYGEQTAVNVQ